MFPFLGVLYNGSSPESLAELQTANVTIHAASLAAPGAVLQAQPIDISNGDYFSIIRKGKLCLFCEKKCDYFSLH